MPALPLALAPPPIDGRRAAAAGIDRRWRRRLAASRVTQTTGSPRVRCGRTWQRARLSPHRRWAATSMAALRPKAPSTRTGREAQAARCEMRTAVPAAASPLTPARPMDAPHRPSRAACMSSKAAAAALHRRPPAAGGRGSEPSAGRLRRPSVRRPQSDTQTSPPGRDLTVARVACTLPHSLQMMGFLSSPAI